jgi:glycine betaine/choline ABC-type transport system substrate-binding protein
VVLGEIVAQHLERHGFAVDRRLNLGGTLLAHEALVRGDIDLYPEYSGTALMVILKKPASPDADSIVAREYSARFGIEWLEPLGFNNTFAMIVRKEESASNLSMAAARSKPWRLGVGYEFTTRPDGLPGLFRVYALRTDGEPRSMDLGLLYEALEQGQVDMVAGSATDGLIAARGFKVLRDDRGFFPPYRCALAVRAARLAATPGLRDHLKELAGRISEDAMRRMNYAIDGEHRPVSEVARSFLRGSKAEASP